MKKGFGIKAKTVFATVSFMAVLTFAIAAIGFKLYKDSVMRSYRAYADTVLKYAYSASVKYSFGDMIAARYMPEKYEELRAELNSIKESSNIEYLYAIYFNGIYVNICSACQFLHMPYVVFYSHNFICMHTHTHTKSGGKVTKIIPHMQAYKG